MENDTNDRTTIHTLQAFGDPDETRLIAVKDANNQSWSYSYNTLGSLTGVVAPDGITRTWEYNSSNLLSRETHPESGTTVYDDYDDAGNLKHRTDAKGTVFRYLYDGNNRLREIDGGGQITRFTYEPGTDNRASATVVGLVATTLAYETTTGRLRQRDDQIDAQTFTTHYAYD